MPRAKAERTKIGVWRISVRSSASAANSKHSATLPGMRATFCVSPCDSRITSRMSPCAVRVGSPVDGPTRWMSQITPGSSAKYPRPANSPMSETPGPEVDVIEERLAERRRRRDGIPRHDGYAAEHGADGGGGIAVDDDLAGGGVHPLHAPLRLPRGA